MYQSLKDRGRAASDYYAGCEEYFYLSPAGLTLLRALEPLVREHCRGRVLDAGAGRGAYRNLLLRYATDYVGMDIGKSNATAVVGDAQRLPFADAAFDTVFCSQVLEHVPEPWLVLAEFRRVLKPGGVLILSVPHISWLHNEPHDYLRFTAHGLRFFLERNGLTINKIEPAGGLFSLLGHIASTLLINTTFGLALLHGVAMSINRLLVRCNACIDTRLEKRKIFALNYVVLCRRSDGEV